MTDLTPDVDADDNRTPPMAPTLAARPHLSIVSKDDIAAAVEALNERIDTRQFTPTRERPVPRFKERGVWIADVLDPFGNPVILSVASTGRCVERIPWLEGQTLEEIEAQMWTRLDLADPLLR